MARSTFADPCRLHVLPSKPAQVIRCEWDAIRSEKYDAVVRLPHDFRSKAIQVHVQPGQSAFTDRNHTVPLAFSFSYGYQTVLLIHVVELQMQKLHAAQSAGVKNFEHGSITDAQRN